MPCLLAQQIGTVARGFTWKLRGDARLASTFAVSWLGVLSPRKACTGLDHAWSEGTQYQCPDEVPGGAEGTVSTEQRFCFVFAVV